MDEVQGNRKATSAELAYAVRMSAENATLQLLAKIVLGAPWAEVSLAPVQSGPDRDRLSGRTPQVRGYHQVQANLTYYGLKATHRIWRDEWEKYLNNSLNNRYGGLERLVLDWAERSSRIQRPVPLHLTHGGRYSGVTALHLTDYQAKLLAEVCSGLVHTATSLIKR